MYKPKLIRVNSYNDMSFEAAKLVIDLVKNKANAILGLATGGTPVTMYELLVKDFNENNTDYSGVSTYNLDEYVGLTADHHQSYAFFMKNHLFNKVNIPPEQTHIPNGLAPSLDLECEQYEEKLARINGVDLQILGVGTNGHIGFNEPGTSFSSKVHVSKLKEKTRNDNARYFAENEKVPTEAITMGISTILSSKKIVLLASGATKAGALRALLRDEMDKTIPINALRLHNDVTIIADDAALSLSL